MRKNYNKYTSILDRFPFITVIFIIGIAIIFLLFFRTKFPFPFFSGKAAAADTGNNCLLYTYRFSVK